MTIYFSEEIIDGFRELITIGIGRSANLLNQLTGAHVSITVPEVKISEIASECYMKSAFIAINPEHTSQIKVKFSNEINGSCNLIIPYSSALNLVSILTGENGSSDEMDALRIETLIEVGNIIISSILSALSFLLLTQLTIQFPVYQNVKSNLVNPIIINQLEIGINARILFFIQNKEIEGELFILLNHESFDYLETCIRRIMREGL